MTAVTDMSAISDVTPVTVRLVCSAVCAVADTGAFHNEKCRARPCRVLAHYAVRRLMYSASSSPDVEPRRLSFVANVQHFKQQQLQSGAFPPARPRLCKCWKRRLRYGIQAVGAKQTHTWSKGETRMMQVTIKAKH